MNHKEKKIEEDPAQEFYREKNAKYDLDRDVDSYAMWGFFLSWAPAIFLLGFPPALVLVPFFCLASILVSILSLVRIKDNKKLKGKGFAIAGIVISFVILIIIVLLVSFVGFVAYDIIANNHS